MVKYRTFPDDSLHRKSFVTYERKHGDSGPVFPIGCHIDDIIEDTCDSYDFNAPNGPLNPLIWEQFSDAVLLNQMGISVQTNQLRLLDPAFNTNNYPILGYYKPFTPDNHPQMSKMIFKGTSLTGGAVNPPLNPAVNVSAGLCVRASGTVGSLSNFTGYVCKYQEQYANPNLGPFTFQGATAAMFKIVAGVVVQSQSCGGTVRLLAGQELQLRCQSFQVTPRDPVQVCLRMLQNGINRCAMTDNGVSSGPAILSGSPGVGTFAPGMATGIAMDFDDWQGCHALLP